MKNYRSSGNPRVLLNSLSDGADIVNGKGDVLAVNAALAEVTIIESHGDVIAVETAVNKEPTFTITMPIKPELEVGGEKHG